MNLGTGGFVLRPTGGTMRRVDGYLAGPLAARRSPSASARGAPTAAAALTATYALEGTIHGAASAADRFAKGPTDLPARDPAPDAFCLPDLAGVGAPHWRPDVSLALSPATLRLGPDERRRVAVEGVLFRAAEILADLFPEAPPRRVVLSGGLARDPAVPGGLAACLGRPIEVLEESEATLVGAGLLAQGLAGRRLVPARAVPPGEAGAYLPEKLPRWRDWLRGVLAGGG